MKNYGENLGWEIDVDFPSWANTEIYVKKRYQKDIS